MVLGFVPRNDPASNPLRDERVIRRQGLEAARPLEIGAAVSDPTDPRAPARGEEDRHGGRAHASQPRVLQGGAVDLPGREPEAAPEALFRVSLAGLEHSRHGLDAQAAGGGAALVPAHAVGHDQKALAVPFELTPGVLVLRTRLADIGQRCRDALKTPAHSPLDGIPGGGIEMLAGLRPSLAGAGRVLLRLAAAGGLRATSRGTRSSELRPRNRRPRSGHGH